MKNKFSKYLIYAIGEIILVVIGILIALQVNNWNETKKTRSFETKILTEMKQSLEQDLMRTELIYKHRALPKQKAISDLIGNITSDVHVSKDELKKNFGIASITLSFYFDKGPFESLKSKGFERIQNDSLRNAIIRFYEVSMPLAIIFIDNNKEVYKTNKYELRRKIVGHQYIKNDTIWRVNRTLQIEKLRKNKEVAELLMLEQRVSDNYVLRLESIIQQYKQMIALIEEELIILTND